MEWVAILACFLTNELRLHLGILLSAKVMRFRPEKGMLFVSVVSGALITVLQVAGFPTLVALGTELLVIAAVTWYYVRDKFNLCLFLVFFYEVGVGLWDFLLRAGLGILFRSGNFINPASMEYYYITDGRVSGAVKMAGVWLISKDGEKPVDGRTKQGRSLQHE